MPVNMGSAEGRLTLRANEFFSSIHTAIDELRNFSKAQADAVDSTEELEDELAGGSGRNLSTTLSEVEDAARDTGHALTGSDSLTDALDDVSESAEDSSDALDDMGDTADKAGDKSKKFGSKFKTAFSNLKNAIPSTEDLTKKLDEFGKQAEKAGKTMSKYITAPLAAVGTYSTKTAMDFEKAMSQVQATMGAPKESMKELEEAAKNMGETTQFTATEAAEALNYLALAGYDSNQMIAALPSVLNLAAAGNMDLARASDMLTDGLSALNLASKDSTELMKNMDTMVDQMAKTASSSNTSVEQLGDAILTVGGTATYLNGGLTEANQVLGLMADRGIKASEAGTHLRNIILAMQPATDEAKAGFERVGLGITDADGKFTNLAYNADGSMKTLQEIFAIMNDGMKDMSDMEKQATIADIFHRTDLAAVEGLLGTSTERWNELGSAIEDSAGAGADMAATQLDNMAGKMTLLKSQIDGVAITIGKELYPQLSKMLDKLSDLITKFSELDPEVQKGIVGFGTFLAVIGPTLVAIGKVATGISALIKLFSHLKTGLAALKGFSVFTKIASWFSKLPALASGAMAKLSATLTGGIEALAAPVTASLSTLLIALAAFLAGYGIGTLIYKAIGDEIDEVLHPIFDGFVAAWEAVVEFFSETVPENVSDFFMKIQEFGENVRSTLGGIVTSVKDFFLGVVTEVSDFFTSVWESIVTTFTGISEWIYSNILEPVLNVIVPIVTKIAEIIAKIWEIVTVLFSVAAQWVQDNVITPILNKIHDFVNKVITFVKDLLTKITEAVKNFVTPIIQFFQDVWDGIVGIFSAIATWWQDHVIEPITDKVIQLKDDIIKFFKDAWKGITEVFAAVGTWFGKRWDDIKAAFSNVATWFKTKFKAAYDAIKEVFGGIKDWFSELWEDIKSVFSDAAIVINDTLEGAFKSAFNSVMERVEGVVNFFVDSINSVVDTINDIPGVDISKLDPLSLPRLSVGLDYVPYDEYAALLHKGERVLTKEENEAYTNNRSGKGDTFIFNSPKPIDEVEAAKQFKQVQQELAEGF